MNAPQRPVVALTAGDPAGIGPEIVLQATTDPEIRRCARVLVVGEAVALRSAASVLGIPVKLCPCSGESASAGPGGDALEVIDTATLTEPVPWGTVTAEGGRAAFEAVRKATEVALSGTAQAVATAPVHKESLKAAGVPYIDHTTAFAALTDSRGVMTMFATGNLRIFFLTRHIALREVPAALTAETVEAGLRSAVSHLRTLGFERPRLALAALNPHGGEHGLFGTEEEEVLVPALKRVADLPAELTGPVPADAVFHQAASGRFDAVLSLYHDQGHIAAKTLDFHGTVSFTLGLPFLRTSVDHGTAFDIAGTAAADPRGMKEAVKAAACYGPAYRTASLRKK